MDAIHRGEDDDLLIRADKTANTAGASMLGLSVGDLKRHLGTLSEDIAGGTIGVLLVLGDTFSADAAATLRAARGKVHTAVFSPFADGPAREADRTIPTAAYGEFAGTWVNFQGRAQQVRRAVEPAGVALEIWYALAELMRRMGAEPGYASAADVLSDVISKFPKIRVTA